MKFDDFRAEKFDFAFLTELPVGFRVPGWKNSVEFYCAKRFGDV